MGCGIVERYLEMGQETKNIHLKLTLRLTQKSFSIYQSLDLLVRVWMKSFTHDSALSTDVHGERGRSLATEVDSLNHVHSGVLWNAGSDVQGDEPEVLGDVETRAHLFQQIFCI